MELEILVAAFIAFISVLLGGQFVLPLLTQSGFVAQDINKKGRPLLPASGGLLLALGFFVGILALLFSMSYIISSSVNVVFLLTTLVSVVAICLVGFMDDLIGSRVRTSKESIRKIAKNYVFFNGGIRQWQKPLLTLVAALPLMTINWGAPVINVPFFGGVAIGQLLFVLVAVPLSLIFSANAFNMLEGLNGISIQMGLVAFIALSLFTYHIGAYTAFAVAAIFSGALLAYLYYGAYPAKVLPGDSLTYLIGATFASVVIIGTATAQGNMFFFGVILIIPWIIEFALKARRRFHANSWGVLQKDGRLTSPHGNEIYSLTHLFLRTGKFEEWQIPLLLTLVEVVIAGIALAWFW